MCNDKAINGQSNVVTVVKKGYGVKYYNENNSTNANIYLQQQEDDMTPCVEEYTNKN